MSGKTGALQTRGRRHSVATSLVRIYRLARITREAQTLAALNHPNIAQIYGLEETDSGRAPVMELVEGEDPADRRGLSSFSLRSPLRIARAEADRDYWRVGAGSSCRLRTARVSPLESQEGSAEPFLIPHLVPKHVRQRREVNGYFFNTTTFSMRSLAS